MSSHLLRVALGMASCIALTACGSTVATHGGSLGGSAPEVTAPGNGLGDGAATTTGGSAGSTGQVGGSTTGGIGGGATGGGTSGGTVPGGSAGGSPSRAGTTSTSGGTTPPPAGGDLGPGITATEVKLGIPYCNDCASGNAAAGASGQDPGDTRRYYQAVLDDVNSHGGVLGRKLVPVFSPVSVSDNIDVSAQRACDTFTKDNKVAAFSLRGELAANCGLKAGIMVLGSGGTGPIYQRYPNLFAPGTPVLEGLDRNTVRAMVKADWQKPTPPWATGKIGLITWDTPEYRYAMTNGYLKAMHEAGLKEEDVRYIAVPQNAAALSDASAAISSAVLAFGQRGIDHVFIGDGPAGIFAGAGLTFLFLSNAKSQRYYPRYGFNTNNAPDFQSHPKDELVGMIAIDSYDTKPANDAGIALNPVRERCFALMRKNGLPVGDDQTRILALNACEIGWFPSAVINKANGSALSRVIPAAEALGASYRSPFTYGTRIAAGKHDGVYLYRNEQFAQGCSCINYTSRPYEP